MKNMQFIPINDVLDSPSDEGIFQVYKDRYWLVTEDRCFIKSTSMQCNSNPNILERLIPYYKEKYNMNVTIGFYDIIFMPINIQDYC